MAEDADEVHIRVRIPGDLRVRLAQSAIAGRRSQTAEIISRLERSFDVERLLDRARMQADADAREIERLQTEMANVAGAAGGLEGLPPRLVARLQSAAAERGRTIMQEIADRLEYTLGQQGEIVETTSVLERARALLEETSTQRQKDLDAYEEMTTAATKQIAERARQVDEQLEHVARLKAVYERLVADLEAEK